MTPGKATAQRKGKGNTSVGGQKSSWGPVAKPGRDKTGNGLQNGVGFREKRVAGRSTPMGSQ